ncbi:SMP-30/gluconolactonase/LRE family protein [Tunicatimonas pelagia]|uniref:SMP-30/gluconolactonase/LRE family protein n=1 Tax=Tunicatimonas pelagia TaxID=931531 RepID=UPI0026660D8E|nr:SMP-30/gluconolactonase/LRE family protein [Tunicatimonas pelagia]WKN45962.1 SMP-30/gluconolactonase/LRE family protein [Tunicatimonas pelagia]
MQYLVSRYLFAFFLLLELACSSSNQSSENNTHFREEISEKDSLYQSQDFTELQGFTKGIEGPAVDAEGRVYAVNFQKQGTIGKITAEGEASVFIELPEGSIGNGIRFNQAGDMLIADYPQHNILKVNMASQSVSVFAHNDSMNQPNDIAITSKDVLFASDPNWSESTGQLWRIDPNGNTALLEENMGTTNGVEVSPDEKTLYVNESVQRVVWAYDLSPDGQISNKRKLITFPDYGMDGIRCDVAGNLYITRHGKGTVVKVSPEGEVLQEIKMTGELPSNIAFGGSDGRTAYVTLQDRGCIETFRVEKPGRAWEMH